jgi:hypothetical protein
MENTGKTSAGGTVLLEGKRYYTKDKLTRIKTAKYDMRITCDSIRVAGYKEWPSAAYMDTNESREVCAAWVVSLIEQGKGGFVPLKGAS